MVALRSKSTICSPRLCLAEKAVTFVSSANFSIDALPIVEVYLAGDGEAFPVAFSEKTRPAPTGKCELAVEM